MATIGNNVPTTGCNNFTSLIVIYLTCLLCLLSSHHQSLQALASSLALPIAAKSSQVDNDVAGANITTFQREQQVQKLPSAIIHTQTQTVHQQFRPDSQLVYHLMTPEQQAELAESIKNISESVRPHQPRNSLLLIVDLDKAKDATENGHYPKYSDQQARVIKGWGMGKGFIG